MRLFYKILPYPWRWQFLPRLEALTFLAWGALLFKYWLTGQIRLLIHPNYISLVVITGGILLFLGFFKLFSLYKKRKQRAKNGGESVVQTVTLFPAGWSTFFLLSTAILGLLIPPTILGSDMALQRGIREALPLTQTQPEQFRVDLNPEERSLIDWIKTFNAYPEPDAYQGEKVKVRGFVIKIDEVADHYFLLAQFIITCCAIDAYPVAIPVKLEDHHQNYPADTWLEIEGEIMTETLSWQGTEYQTGQSTRQIMIQAQTVREIPTPRNPYGY